MKDNIVVFDSVGPHSWSPAQYVTEYDVLVVGGGGGGGVTIGGGGGAGGLVFQSNVPVGTDDVSIYVGSGGEGGEEYSTSGLHEDGFNGEDSTFEFGSTTIRARGGGGGGGWSGYTPHDGGSGGGGAARGDYSGQAALATQPGTNAFAQNIDAGNDGGDGIDGTDPRSGGGGGGAGEPGHQGIINERSGDGGDGLDMSDTFGIQIGDDGWFAGGGGGGGESVDVATRRAYGGKGGGGKGSAGVPSADNGYGESGMANTGGGGGAGAYQGGGTSTDPLGGAGGSGIVVIGWDDQTLPMRIYENGQWRRVENLSLGNNIDADTVDGKHASELSGVKNNAKFSSSDTSTNINPSGWVKTQWDMQMGVDAGYTHDPSGSPTEITFDNSGTYQIHTSLSFNSGGVRVSPGVKFAINGTRRNAMGMGGYIRSGSGHNDASAELQETITVNAGDTLSVQSTEMGAGGTVNLRSGESVLEIQQLSELVPVAKDADTVDGYDIHVNGSDEDGVINFKT